MEHRRLVGEATNMMLNFAKDPKLAKYMTKTAFQDVHAQWKATTTSPLKPDSKKQYSEKELKQEVEARFARILGTQDKGKKHDKKRKKSIDFPDYLGSQSTFNKAKKYKKPVEVPTSSSSSSSSFDSSSDSSEEERKGKKRSKKQRHGKGKKKTRKSKSRRVDDSSTEDTSTDSSDSEDGHFYANKKNFYKANRYDFLEDKSKKVREFKEGGQSIKFDFFSGYKDASKALSFIQQLDIAFTGGCYSEHSKIRRAASYLKGNARTWWSTLLLNKTASVKWLKFKKLFISSWLTQEYERDIRAAWNHLRMTKRDTVDAYWSPPVTCRPVGLQVPPQPAKSASTSPCHQAPRSPQAFLHESAAIRLTEDQIGLLFSFLWRGLSLDNNMPRNYQANFRTATLMLQLSPARKSKDIFARVFQFSLSLRTMASRRDGHLSSARKRSLLTLSSAMLTVASNFYNIAGMEDAMKALREPSQMDPFLTFLEGELKIRDGVDPSHYGTPADNAAASKFLDQISKDIEYSNELLVSLVLSSSSTIFELDPVRLRDELLQPFSPTYCGFSLDLDANSSRTQPWIAVLHKSSSFDEAISSQDDCTNDNAFADLPEILISNPVCKPSASVMGVTQLLKSALEMAGQVAKIKAAAAPLSFSAVAMKCEDFGSSGRRKMPIWTNIDEYTQTLPLMASQHHIELIQAKGWSGQKDCEGVEFCSLPKPDHHKSCQTLQLPPVSHYDNFLRAAGC
ncbi:hypothetical protein L7F22_040364 [Adiantum nelumboides]|nr:hypothetical protein [Adiantum nelumboides]